MRTNAGPMGTICPSCCRPIRGYRPLGSICESCKKAARKKAQRRVEGVRWIGKQP